VDDQPPARPPQTWFLIGLLVGLVTYALLGPTLGLILAVLVLVPAVVASRGARSGGAWAAYLCGVGVMAVPIAIAVTVASPMAGALLVVGCAAVLALGVAGLGLLRDRRPQVHGR